MYIGGVGIELQGAGGGAGPIPAGQWVPWDALVSNNPGIGDYLLISAACAAQPAGAVIAVDCNSTTPYVETANIVLKEGQVVFAYDGQGRTAGTVSIIMGAFNVQMPNANAVMTGITFDWNPMGAGMAGRYLLDIAGTNCRVEQCYFNGDPGGGGVANRGFRLTGGSVYMRNVDFYCSPTANQMMNVSGTGEFYNCIWNGPGVTFAALISSACLWVDCDFFGASPAPGTQTVVDTSSSKYVRCRFSDSMSMTGCYNGSNNDQIFESCRFNGGSGNTFVHSGNNIRATDCQFYTGGGTALVLVSGQNYQFTACTFDGAPVSVAAAASYVKFVNCNFLLGLANPTIAGDYVSFVNCNASTQSLTTVAGATGVFSYATEFGAVFDGTNRYQRGVMTHIASAPPGVADDTTKGYIAGLSRWFNTTNFQEYLCKGDGAGVANWVPATAAGGPSLWTVLVHPTVGWGNYQTIGAAVSGEAAGVVIGVAPGTYAEGGNITFKEGQSVIALGGTEGDDQISVRCNLGTNRIIINAGIDEVTIKGIYFYRAANADNAFVTIGNGALNTIVQDCTFDCTPTGAQVHRGWDLGSCQFGRFENIRIIGDPLMYSALYLNGTLDCQFKNWRITGGQTTAVAGQENLIRQVDIQRNTWDNIRVSNLAATDAGGAIFGISLTANGDPCHYRNIYIELGIVLASGTAIRYVGTGQRDKGDDWIGLTIDGSYIGVAITRINNIKFTNCAIGVVSGNFVGLNCFQLIDAQLLLITGCQLYATAGQCVVTVAGVTFSNYLKIVSSDLSTAAAIAVLSAFADSFWNITDCAIVGNFDFTGGGGYLHINGIQLFGTLNVSGVLTTDVLVDNSYIFTAVVDTTRFRASNCYIFNITVGGAATSADNFITGCSIFGTLTNGANSSRLTIGNCIIGAFADNGHDTIRDVYTQQTVLGNISIRGSRDYNNTGAVGGFTLTLPDPAVVQVSVGYRFRAAIIAAQLLTIVQPALQVIHLNGVSSTPGVGGSCASNTQWSILELEYKGGNNWLAESALGAWVLV